MKRAPSVFSAISYAVANIAFTTFSSEGYIVPLDQGALAFKSEGHCICLLMSRQASSSPANGLENHFRFPLRLLRPFQLFLFGTSE